MNDKYIATDEKLRAKMAANKAKQYERRRRLLEQHFGIRSAEALVNMWRRGEIKIVLVKQ